MPLARPDSASTPADTTAQEIGTLAQAEACLGDPDADLRRRAVRAFVDLGGAPGTLCHRLETEDSLVVMETAMTELVEAARETEAGHPTRGDVVSAIAALLRSPNASLRVHALAALQDLPDDTAALVPDLIADPDPDVRVLAANLLQDFPHPNTLSWLREILCTDPHVNVCMAAAEALAECGTPDMVADLDDLVDRFPDQPFVAAAVAHVTRLIDGRSETDGA